MDTGITSGLMEEVYQITSHGKSGGALRIFTRLFSETSMYGELLFVRVS